MKLVPQEEKKDVSNIFVIIYGDKYVGLFKKINWSTKIEDSGIYFSYVPTYEADGTTFKEYATGAYVYFRVRANVTYSGWANTYLSANGKYCTAIAAAAPATGGPACRAGAWASAAPLREERESGREAVSSATAHTHSSDDTLRANVHRTISSALQQLPWNNPTLTSSTGKTEAQRG